MEFLIPLLFFAIPVAAAILDKRAKTRNPGRFPVRTTTPPPPPAAKPQAERPMAHDALQEEGIRAIKRQSATDKPAETETGKLEIDKKKLILYAEILTPKFDE